MRETMVSESSIVRHCCEITYSAPADRFDCSLSYAAQAEASGQDGRPILDILDRLIRRIVEF